MRGTRIQCKSLLEKFVELLATVNARDVPQLLIEGWWDVNTVGSEFAGAGGIVEEVGAATAQMSATVAVASLRAFRRAGSLSRRLAHAAVALCLD